ncbi:MAG: histidine phosphatase family protein [Gammaproteobacteria bacterium]|nr:histidine phosphatase family protein [Gammaproteobacteria bacterium]
MSVLYLVRHGQASFGADDYDRLSPAGLRQAELLADHWLALDRRLDAVYAGSLVRQRDTAATVAQRFRAAGRPLRHADPSHEFDEYAFQPLLERHACEQGAALPLDWAELARDRAAFHRFLESALHAWTRGALVADGAETWLQFRARCVAGLERVMRELGQGRSAAVFTSAGAIGAIVQHVLGLNDARTVALKLTLYNCSVTKLLFDGRTVTLESFNAIAHLERPEHTDLVTFR